MCELMKQQETHLKQQVSNSVCVLSLVIWFGFPSSLSREQPRVP